MFTSSEMNRIAELLQDGPQDMTIWYQPQGPYDEEYVGIMIEWPLYGGGDAESGPDLDVEVVEMIKISNLGKVSFYDASYSSVPQDAYTIDEPPTLSFIPADCNVQDTTAFEFVTWIETFLKLMNIERKIVPRTEYSCDTCRDNGCMHCQSQPQEV